MDRLDLLAWWQRGFRKAQQCTAYQRKHQQISTYLAKRHVIKDRRSADIAMAASLAFEQWALATPVSFASFEAWKNNLIHNLSLEEKFTCFMKPGHVWLKKTRSTPNRGYKGANARLKAINLELFLNEISRYVPEISRRTIVEKSTSLASVWEAIREHYGIQANGAKPISLLASVVQHIIQCLLADIRFKNTGAYF